MYDQKIKITFKVFFLERERERERLDKVVTIVFVTSIKTFRKNRSFRKHEFLPSLLKLWTSARSSKATKKIVGPSINS